MKPPTARTTTISFFDTTTNLWLDAFLAGRGVILTMMTTATTTTKMMGDFDGDNNSNNYHKDNDNNDARMFHLCQEGGINWVDGGMTKQQSTNLA